MARQKLPPARPGYRWIFRASKRCPETGKTLFARDYGLRGFPIEVPI